MFLSIFQIRNYMNQDELKDVYMLSYSQLNQVNFSASNIIQIHHNNDANRQIIVFLIYERSMHPRVVNDIALSDYFSKHIIKYLLSKGNYHQNFIFHIRIF